MYKMRIALLALGSMLCLTMNLQSQVNPVVYTHSFGSKLAQVGADFMRPVEGFYKIKLLEKDQHLDYDLVLRSEDKAFEMRFVVDPNYRRGVPHIQCFNTLNSIAINEEHFDIRLVGYEEQKAIDYYGADWAAFADFVPKRSFTDFHYGRIVTIYKEGQGLIHQILLFNEHDREKDLRMYSIRFLPEEE